jgi:hypothetical protein
VYAQTITLSGSITRAMTAMRRLERHLVLHGHTVYVPCPPLPGEPPLTPEQLAALTAGHHRAIRHADLVIAVVPDGYIGASTREELAYAQSLDVPTEVVVDVDAWLTDLTTHQPA